MLAKRVMEDLVEIAYHDTDAFFHFAARIAEMRENLEAMAKGPERSIKKAKIIPLKREPEN